MSDNNCNCRKIKRREYIEQAGGEAGAPAGYLHLEHEEEKGGEVSTATLQSQQSRGPA